MARTKKVIEDKVGFVVKTDEASETPAIADCTEYVSIAFDKNGNLYGVTKHGELFKYEWTERKWEAV